MAIVPLAFFVFFVVAASGGPAQFVSNVTYWINDFVVYCGRLVKSF
jgi:hypothetical protein